MAVLLEEEPMQQHVHAQESLARERHALARVLSEITVSLDRSPRRRETSADIDAEFLCEVRRSNAAAFELQNRFSNQPLIVVWPIRAAERQFAAFDRRRVGLPRVHVLHVDAVDVTERRNAERGEIGALPQLIAIRE